MRWHFIGILTVIVSLAPARNEACFEFSDRLRRHSDRLNILSDDASGFMIRRPDFATRAVDYDFCAGAVMPRADVLGEAASEVRFHAATIRHICPIALVFSLVLSVSVTPTKFTLTKRKWI